MLEKRFTQKDEDDWEILDRNKHFAYAHSGYQAKKIIERLNELDTENNILKATNAEMEDYLARLEEENKELKEIIKEIKRE